MGLSNSLKRINIKLIKMKKNLPFGIFLFCINCCFAQSGQLDPAFGVNGIVTADMGSSFNYSNAASQALIQQDESIYIICNSPVFISKRRANGSIDSGYGFNGYSRAVPFSEVYATFQPDGKIIIVGSGYNSCGIERMNMNGMPDSTFGNNGIQPTNFRPIAVSIKRDGKIVVVGVSDNTSRVAQFNQDGSPDFTFNGSGQAPFDFVFKIRPPRGSIDSGIVHTGYANSVAIQTDGKVVVGGNVYSEIIGSNFAIARYNLNGSLDSTFDYDGKQTTSIGNGAVGYSLAVQTDGKILMSGATYVGSNKYFAVVRYHLNGSLDNSFNGNGKQTANLSSDFEIGNSLAIQSNGKILLGGFMLNGAYHDFALARLNADGKADSSFDKDGILITDFNSSDDYAGSVVIQQDDKIVVTGHSNIYASGGAVESIAILRFSPDGSLDNSFANNGKLIGNYQQGYTSMNATVIQKDGKILAAGFTWNALNTDFLLARYNSDGSLDKTFGNEGKQITDFGASDEVESILLQHDGKIVVAGNSYSGNNHYQFAVARYHKDGMLDKSFSTDGKLLVSAIGKTDLCRSIALQNDGKIVMVGYTFTGNNNDSAHFSIVRLNMDGSFDDSFGEDGKLLTSFNTASNFASAVAIQTDGKIVVGGRIFLNNQDYFALARYNIDGSADTTFSQDGKQYKAFGKDNYFLQSMVIQNNGKIVAAGFSETPSGGSSSFAIARFNSNGELDTSFNNDGYQSTLIGPSFNFGMSVAVNYDGRIAVGGTNDKFAIVMYKNDGDLDNTFGINGVQITAVGVFESRIQSVVFDFNRIYAVGYAQYPGIFGVIARYLFFDGGALPVSLGDFKAVLQNDCKVLLQWQTENVQNLSGFNIQRSVDANHFYSIDYVTAKGSGNSKINYLTFDKQPLKGINFYRLKIVDTDGKFTYSKIESVVNNQALFSLHLFPNPAKNILLVSATTDNEKVTFQIIDVGGRILKEGSYYLSGNITFGVDIVTLPKGIYYFQLITKSTSETRRFVKD